MEFGGRYKMTAPRVRIWAALNDPEMLKAAIPGCSLIEWSGPEMLDLEIKVNLGVVKPTFRGELVLSNIVPAESYTLSGRGKGGMLGLAEGSADVALADDGDDTILTFTANGGASGQIRPSASSTAFSSGLARRPGWTSPHSIASQNPNVYLGLTISRSAPA
jgi:carbon monoxide dehydrogenase subunit G